MGILPNMNLRKDQSLDQLARAGNVAQFVSYVPVSGGLEQSYCGVAGYEPNAAFGSVHDAAQVLLDRSVEGAVNVRSYTPDSPRSREFVYGLTTSDAVVESAS